MSYLGAVLDLPEGSRLTGINLTSPTVYPWSSWSTAHVQIVHLPETVEPSATAGALGNFIPELFASLHGTSPDGGSWATFLLLAHSDRRVIPHDDIALAPLRRAMDLLGIHAVEQKNVLTTEKALQRAYWQKGTSSVDEWSIDELLLGLLVELTEAPLREAVEFAKDSGQPTPHGERLTSLLESWTAR